MNPQLRWITRLFEDHGIHYWLDSGTLLGVIREGGVMGHDKDIDLSIWSEEREKFQALTGEFQEAGYKVKEGRFDGMPYNFVLTPQDPDGIAISIGIYRRQDDRAWRMATYVTDNPYPRWGLRFLLRGAWRFPIRQGVRVLTQWVPRARLVTTWPFCLVLGAGIWVIPKEYVEETVIHEPTDLPIPAKWNAYLTYRYGDWREPVRDWLWYRDDRAAHTGDPDQLMDNLAGSGTKQSQ